MVREPDATMQPTLQDNQLMSKHRVLGFKPQLRLEWRGQDGQNETKQPDHSASLGDFITSSTRIRFSVRRQDRVCLAPVEIARTSGFVVPVDVAGRKRNEQRRNAFLFRICYRRVQVGAVQGASAL